MVAAWACAILSWTTELPSFPKYPPVGRSVQVLSGEWEFGFSSTYNASTTVSLHGIVFNRMQNVPAAWDAAADTGLQFARGVGVYRTSVSVPAGAPSLLHFEACSLFCRIYVDGALVHNHSLGGFTPFWVTLPPCKSESLRKLTVLTSNVFSTQLTPTQYKYYDFYQYGGLLRTVSLHVLSTDGPTLERIEVTPLALADKPAVPSGEVDVRVVLRNPPSAGTAVDLRLGWDGAASGTASTHTVQAGGVITLASVSVPNPKLWQPLSNPVERPSLALHQLTVSLPAPINSTEPPSPHASSAVADAITVRFGLRIVKADGRSILINGHQTKLKGVNRHDLHPDVGPSLSVRQYEHDLDLLQLTLHGNFVRGSHYPQDGRFLDLCDERGVLVWNEALGWGNWLNMLTDPTFMKAELGTAHAMVSRSFNRPSVVLWGFFNEGQSDRAAACPSYAAMAHAFRSRDSSRLVTWASNRKSGDLCLKEADVISFNAYPGWYGGNASTVNSSWLWDANWTASNWPQKPFIISETGAGGIAGNRSASLARWSEEYQRLVDGYDVATAMDSAQVAGIALWQFSDIKVDEPSNSTRRPGGINNKGVFTRWRQPKLAVQRVSAIYGAQPSCSGSMTNGTRPGHDYASLKMDAPNDTAGACRKLCCDDPRCATWVYVPDGLYPSRPAGTFCWLKAMPLALKSATCDSDKPGCVSGVVNRR